MPTECCVPLCTNKGGHAFPLSRPKIAKAWKIAVKRDKWEPTKHSVVCRSHFTPTDYIQKTTSGTTPLQRKLKSGAIPSIFKWTPAPSKVAISRNERVVKRRKLDMGDQEKDLAWQPVGAFEEIETVSNHEDTDEVNKTPTKVSREIHVQTETMPRFTSRDFLFDDEGIHYYTGLENYDKFKFVLSTLGPATHQLNYYYGWIPSISIEDQFFMTLIRLRRHKPIFELSRLFSTTESGVTNVFITWINFMSLQWGETDWWPSRNLVKLFSPTDFKCKFPNTRVIIDGTECPIQKPKQPVSQQATFSTYKNTNTMKVLVGCTPGGLVSYTSPAYGGSTSDRQIVERSSLPNMCDSGDSIMADKGFNVQDLFIPNNVIINIPTFFKKKNRLSGEIVMKDRKIASKRVHVERVIGLAKTFKVLKKPLNATESAIATEIIQVCFYLCNFRNNIVPKDA